MTNLALLVNVHAVIPGFDRWTTTTEITRLTAERVGQKIPFDDVQTVLLRLVELGNVERRRRGHGYAWRLK